MSNGSSRAFLAKSIIEFDYAGFFSEMENSIELSYDTTDHGAEIAFDPEVNDRFLYASFWFCDKQGKGYQKIKLKMFLWNDVRVEVGIVPQADLNMFLAFLSELYRKVAKDNKDRAKLDSALNKIVKVQKKSSRARGMTV